jgi:hypothetical protein
MKNPLPDSQSIKNFFKNSQSMKNVKKPSQSMKKVKKRLSISVNGPSQSMKNPLPVNEKPPHSQWKTPLCQ